MVFKSTGQLPSETYRQTKGTAAQLKRQMQERIANWADGGTAAEVLSTIEALRTFRVAFNNTRNIPGITEHAIEQENDNSYDVVAEITMLIAAIDQAVTDIIAAIPKDGSDYLLVYKINSDGALIPRAIPAAGLSNVLAALNSLDSAIA